MEKMSVSKHHQKYGKRHQVSFRITELAWDRLQQAADLFNLSPAHYAKAVLYKDLGLFNEPIDRRKRSFRRRRRKELEELDRMEENLTLEH